MRRGFHSGWRETTAVALALTLAALTSFSCGTSAPITHDDGAASGADVQVDRPVGAGGSDGSQSPPDTAIDGSSGIGTTCATDGECQSGHCADGICCTEACSMPCHTCALPGSVGTCMVADFGTDPHDNCADQGIASCGTDGACDGSGACRKYATGAVCKQPSCSGSTLTLASRCAAGACAPTSGQPCDPYMCGIGSTSCPGTCTRDQDCLPPNVCTNGSCGKRPLGGPCEVDDDCNSMKCQQKVCCGTLCSGTCQSCALPGSEGTCTNVPDREDPLNQCNDTGTAGCGTDGSCDGAGVCRRYASGTTCRPVAGVCDVAETCAGAGAPCPPDGFVTGTTCRASNGVCDQAEICSGSSASCPPDGFVAVGTVCRAVTDVCDIEETCSGSSAACPPNAFALATRVCRASAGMCDQAETCSGTGAACPADLFAAATVVCRLSAGGCDTPETCSGSGAACPTDAFQTAGTPCRAASGLCDAVESCSGTSAACPADGFLPVTMVCRPAAGMCDVAETCSGTGPACPADVSLPATTVCRPASGVCDLAETCPGNGPACPDNVVATSGTPCRSSVGGCDLAEVCDGVAGLCPLDASALPPGAPTNLAATRGNGQATLTWTAVAGASSYNIKRSTTSGGPYTTVGTATATTFPSTGLTNGTTYFFVVSAASQGGGCESANSAQVAVIPSVCPGVYCDDFEADVAGTMANGWTRVGGSDGDWSVESDGSKFLKQHGQVSSTLRACFTEGAPGAPWSGAITISADVKITALGLSGQAAMVCPRFVDLSNYYCLALVPAGIQIQARVNGGATNSAVFAQTITVGSIHQVRMSLSSAGVLSVLLDNSVGGSLTPPALASGFAAVVTQSCMAEFDTIVVSQP